VLDALSAWDGLALEDAVASTTIKPEQIVFDTWLALLIEKTFSDEFAEIRDFKGFTDHHFNFLLHALQGEDASVPVSQTYFDDQASRDIIETADDQIVASMKAAIGTLTAKYSSADPNAWVEPRPDTEIRHLGPPELGVVRAFPGVNSGVYSYIAELKPGNVGYYAVSRFQFGQSGFLGMDADGRPTFEHPHVFSMLKNYVDFEFQPMFE